MAATRKERGGALVIFAAGLFLGAAVLFAGRLVNFDASAERERASERALGLAREALVAFAAARPIDTVVGPGYLPCPDLDDDGWAESTCGSLDGQSGQARRLGRLPWKTLGLAPLRDGHGELLWYAVSSKHKGLLNCAASPACVDMGPAAAVGTISLRDATGTTVHDGRALAASADGRSGALAVVIAPGPPLGDQARPCPPHCEPRHFMEAHGIEDNADFSDRNDPEGRPGNGNGFRQGPVRRADGTLAVNDRIMALTYEELMPRILARVAAELAACLRAFAAHPGHAGRYPAPLPACRHVAAGPPGAFGDCNIAPGLHPSWWDAWQGHVAYAVAPGFRIEPGAIDFVPPPGRQFAVQASLRQWPACESPSLAWNPAPGDVVVAYP